MTIEVDQKFRDSGRVWRKRRRQRMIKRIIAGAFVLLSIGLLAVAFIPRNEQIVEFAENDPSVEATDANSDTEAGDEVGFVQSEATAQAAIELAAAAAEAFLDIRGSPMILNIIEGSIKAERKLIADTTIDVFRAPSGSRLVSIEDRLLDADHTVQLSIPSSSADLAAFQNRRSTAFQVETTALSSDDTSTDEVEAGTSVNFDDGEGSWGVVVGGKEGTNEQKIEYVDTVIENTTTQRSSLPNSERRGLFEDKIIRLKSDRKLADVLLENGLSKEDATEAISELTRLFEEHELSVERGNTIKKNGLVALRSSPSSEASRLMQMSIYTSQQYVATLVQPKLGEFALGADPWFSEDLLVKATIIARSTESRKEVRLKDAFYSAALRNGLPSDLVGELMVMLARIADLDKFAGEKDRFHILYSSDESLLPAARLLYAKLSIADNKVLCYVVRNEDNAGTYECYDPNQKTVQSASRSVFGNGFVVPVNGTKTSSFGPRFHPILKKHVNHNGVDWGAPTGTPVHATTAGKVSRANVSPSYGNIIYIDHPGGMQSRYAHLNKFADGIRLGSKVEKGQLIGFVGTTGRSTGPHLHFELHVGGKPVNPLVMSGAATSGRGSTGAVEALVNRIIQVESAGNARAKNTRSTATGLGQFIESTWLRMMRTYRPDLAKTLGRRELLDLRFDPAMSRQMVTNLARENEAFLRARGHASTRGRLYLAHFLGPAGAHIALRADPQASVLNTMGPSVVKANPFLKGWTVLQMTNWSDRKMNRKGSKVVVTNAPAPQVAKQVSKAVKEYRASIDNLLSAL